MLQIILLILKFIGLTLLILLGLLLLMFVVVLFVPLRYKISASSKNDELYLNGTVSWLLHLVHARVKIEEKNLRIWVRLFGIKIFDNLKKNKPKKEKSYHKTYKTKTKKDSVNRKETTYKYKEETEDKTEEKTEDKTHYDRAKQYEEDNTTIMDKIYNKINNIINKVKRFFIKIRDKIVNIFKKLFDIKQKIEKISYFIRDEINKEGFAVVYGSIKDILKHVKPTEFNMELLFGTGDPSSTGKVLGVLSIIYSLYGENIEITPDFEKKVIEGSLDAKGRIRLVTIIIIVIKLIFDKRFKRLKNNFSILKEGYDVR